MNVTDIIALAKAGFTAQQIAQLDTAQAPEQKAAKDETPAPAPAPAKPDTKAQEQEKSKEIPGQMSIQQIATPNPDPIAMLMTKLDTLTTAVQAGAIGRSEQPAAQSVDDIIASIINPPTNGDKAK